MSINRNSRPITTYIARKSSDVIQCITSSGTTQMSENAAQLCFPETEHPAIPWYREAIFPAEECATQSANIWRRSASTTARKTCRSVEKMAHVIQTLRLMATPCKVIHSRALCEAIPSSEGHAWRRQKPSSPVSCSVKGTVGCLVHTKVPSHFHGPATDTLLVVETNNEFQSPHGLNGIGLTRRRNSNSPSLTTQVHECQDPSCWILVLVVSLDSAPVFQSCLRQPPNQSKSAGLRFKCSIQTYMPSLPCHAGVEYVEINDNRNLMFPVHGEDTLSC